MGKKTSVLLPSKVKHTCFQRKYYEHVTNILPVSLRFFKAHHDFKAGHLQLHLDAVIMTACTYLRILLRLKSASFPFFKAVRSQHRIEKWFISLS